MADTNEHSGITAAFRVPKRNLSINGIDKKNRPHNNRFSRPINKNEDFEKLVESGVISSVTLGSKNCFFVKELTEDDKQKLATVVDAENKVSQLKYSFADTKDAGWWTINTTSKDGVKPCKELEDAIKEYHSFEDPENKNCLTMYGEIGFKVDFSKFNMICDDEGGIIYPYGVLFFSDSKSFVNQFSATCAVLPERLERARNNAYITQVDNSNWTGAEIKGSYRSSGHFIIFYVSKEEKDEDTGTLYPVMSTIRIDTILNREREGTITAVGISKVEQADVVARDIEGDSFGSHITYLIKNIFSKYSPMAIASSRFVSDYIYLVGDNPRYYDLSCFNTDENTERNKKDFGNKNSDKKVTESKSTQKNKPKKNNKKNDTVDGESNEPKAVDNPIISEVVEASKD